MSMEVLNRHWEELLAKENVLNTAVGHKFKDGKDTGQPSIVIYVSKKRPSVELAIEHLIPSEIDGVPTDVVELAPTTWTAGRTSISQLHPAEQIKKLGAKLTNPKVALAPPAKIRAASGAADHTAIAQPIQDQKTCGSCLAFDYIGVWEACIAIAAGSAVAIIKLSEGHAFFCCPGASCENGSDAQSMIVPCMSGVALERDYPYTDTDQACGSGLLNNDWYLRAKRLAGQNAISDPTQIMVLLDAGPLVATMQVPQSFMNYTGGIYTSLGPSDPIVGGHGVGEWGYYDFTSQPFRIMRNQWGLGWGQNCVINGIARPGWFMTDPNLLDTTRYQLLLSNAPVPAPSPSPTPSPCKAGNGIASVLNIWSRAAGRKGRFFYLNPPKKN